MSAVNQISTLLRDKNLLKGDAFIGGKWLQAKSGKVFSVINPGTGDEFATVPNLDVSDAQDAIASAEAAFVLWRAKTGKERAAVLRKWFDLITEHVEDLGIIMSLEQGKPLAEAKGEIYYGASFIEWFAEEAKRVTGAIPSSTWEDKRLMVLKQPVGVCAAITPWNFPSAMITRKVSPALAAGCSIIIKPAEQTPLSALALAELASRAGVPDGVINILTADAHNSIEIGKALCDSLVVKHLSFTGSTEVGKLLMMQCAPTVKKIALELGGHAPFIVFEDANIDNAVTGAMFAKYRNAGQACIAANRFYVHKTVHDEFVEKFAAATKKIKVGHGLEPGVTQGPLIDEDALAKVQRHITDALAKGAKLVAGGQPSELGGNFFDPTILANANHSMLVASEETFGPVAPVIPFETDEEVIRLANHSQFGLGSYFYSQNISRIWRVAEALEFGMVGVNTGLFSNEVGPFGGVKQSGLGREGSSWGIDEYLEMKYVCVGLQKIVETKS